MGLSMFSGDSGGLGFRKNQFWWYQLKRKKGSDRGKSRRNPRSSCKNRRNYYRSWSNFWRSRRICHYKSIRSIWKHIVDSLAWNYLPININPKHHLFINHLCHNQKHLGSRKELAPYHGHMHLQHVCLHMFIQATCVFFLWVSCQDSGHFLSMWHHRT